ncbi:MAG: hypothetical protein ACREDH_01290, partial [Methylocella sp.]
MKADAGTACQNWPQLEKTLRIRRILYKMQNIIGWDVGGAHLKAARVENGIITQAAQIACPLWLGLGEFAR